MGHTNPTMDHPKCQTKINPHTEVTINYRRDNKKIANSDYHQQTLPQLTAYLHACVGSIQPTTCMKGISKDWFSSCP